MPLTKLQEALLRRADRSDVRLFSDAELAELPGPDGLFGM